MPSGSPCVNCRQRPSEPRWRPFCSERCKMADLGRWLSGDYRVADPGMLSNDSSQPDDRDLPDDQDHA